LRSLELKILVYFMSIWNMLWLFGIFYSSWYISFRFGKLFQ
jgi:hypothetical protein